MVTKKNAAKLVEVFESLPSHKEMAAVAEAGTAKKGWYANSTQALLAVFAADAPRFAALLAALSPQTSVESNLYNALSTWKNWLKAGRPTSPAKIKKILAMSVEGDSTMKSVLPAWINNSIRALTHDFAKGPVTISGPKVNSFMQNLVGIVTEVTNDAWMANYAGIDQNLFSGATPKAARDKIGAVGVKGAGYLAANAKVRQTAAYLTKLTGEAWTPAEVQETVWSWAKALYEMQSSGVTATQALEGGALTDSIIGAVPDFSLLFTEQERYHSELVEAGYGKELEKLRSGVGSDISPRRGRAKQFATGEKGSGARSDRERHLSRAARRLTKLKRTREAAKAAKVEGAETTFSLARKADADHQAAVESGDTEAAQRMVDEAAKQAGSVVKVLRGDYDPFHNL